MIFKALIFESLATCLHKRNGGYVFIDYNSKCLQRSNPEIIFIFD